MVLPEAVRATLPEVGEIWGKRGVEEGVRVDAAGCSVALSIGNSVALMSEFSASLVRPGAAGRGWVLGAGVRVGVGEGVVR